MKIIENRIGDIEYYEFHNLKEVSFVEHLFSSRIGWTIENTFDTVSRLLKVPRENIISLKQVHGRHIEILKEGSGDPRQARGLEGDGLISNIKDLVLLTYHADCLPVYFIDKKNKTIGLAHAGWQGSYKNISGQMVKGFIENFDSRPEDLLVTIGPSIGPSCYEISKELGDKFLRRYKEFPQILLEKNNKVYLDLWALNYLQLKKENVLKDNILISKACTSCHNDKFHSYRREKGTRDRMVAAIKLS